MALAIFDLDNTLIAGDSDALWGEFMASNGLVDAAIYRQANNDFYEQYKQGALNIHEYLNFSLKPLTEHTLEALANWHSQFMAQHINPILLAKGQAQIDQHRQQGDHIMIITATNRFIAGPIANTFNVDTLLAIDLEVNNNRYTGNVNGVITYQHGKVVRLQNWLQAHPEHTMENSYFYSDSKNDLPLLQQVDHPVAVDPDPDLAAVASKNNWSVVSFR